MPLSARRLLLSLADNSTVRQTISQNGLSKGLIQRFVAGETLSEALTAAKGLQAHQINTALDLLGENVATEAEAETAASAYIAVLEALAGSGLPSPYISIKLTALGLDLGDALAAGHLRRLLTAAQAAGDVFVRVDMEGAVYTQRTLDIVRAAHAEFAAVGTVLQSYLYRTDADLKLLIAEGIRVRLVKGAYAEPASVAYPNKADVDAAYIRQMQALLLDGDYPAVATQDEAIIHKAKQFLREQKLSSQGFEFQMLLGIRRDLQEGLAAEGYNVRAYVPFGGAWYPYFMRRLAERPANVAFVLKNLVR